MLNHRTLSVSFEDSKPHYELLDGLRGVAALLVLIYHIFEGFSFAEVTNGAGSGIITTLNHGHIAVDFFFILSGFVISYAYDDRWSRMSVGDFFKRRLIRLHPMVVMGALIGAVAFIADGSRQWSGVETPIGWTMLALLFTMFMVPALPGLPYEVRGNGEMFPLNGPAWSLFFEYVGNILYAFFIRRLSTKMLAMLTFALGIAHICFFAGDISGYGSVGVGWTIDGVNFCGGLLRMLFPFTMGMLLARTFVPRRVRGAFWICTTMLVAIFSMPYIAPVNGISLNSIYEVACIVLLFPLIVWMGACGSCADSATRRINKFLGDISYPLYIVHYPIMYIFYRWLIEKRCYTLDETWVVASMVVLSSILMAYTVLKLYDEPVRRYLTGKFSKNR